MIVATGGFASSPVLLALAVLKFLRLTSARSFVHEQNVVPGKVNTMAARIVDQIGVSFKASLPFFPPDKAVFTGYPIRHTIGTGSRSDARAELGIPEDATVVFAFGASSGARSINRAVVDALPLLLARPDVHVVHLTGRTCTDAYDAVKDTADRLKHLDLSSEYMSRYHQSAYSHDIQDLYAACDIVIGRASAGVITEIGVCGRPSILVPLPYAPGDHQAMNARTLESAGAAYVIYESVALEHGRAIGTVNSRRLAQRVFDILDDPDRQTTMGRHARETFDQHGLARIVDRIEMLLDGETADSVRSANGAAHSEANHKETDIHRQGPPLSAFALVRKFSRGRDEDFIRATGEDYLKYRVDGFLKSERWPIRNEGVKLVGLLGYEDRIPFLVSLLQDRTPASRLQRLFGGDFKQVGFIRRNAVTALQQLGVYNEELRHVLLDLTEDPYFEVRSAAARALAALIPRDETLADADLTRMRALMNDRSFEVRAEAILMLGNTGPASIIDDLRPRFLAPNWKVRKAVICALMQLVRRNLIADPDELQKELDNILITCVHFEPTFPIKQALNELNEVIRQHRTA